MNKYILLIIMLILIFPLFYWRSKTFRYKCPYCGNLQRIHPLKLYYTPHLFSKRYLTCPNCGKSSMMDPVPDE